MDSEYEVSSTSRQSANVTDVVLADYGTTRRILRPQVVENPNDPRATVRICVLHQRRSKTQEWEDFPKTDLRELKAGEEACFVLRSQETLRLYEELQKLYEIGSEGVSIGSKKYIVVGVDGEETETLDLRSVINHLIHQGREFVEAVKELDPDILRKLKDADPDSFERFVENETLESRKKAIACFRLHLEANDWDELAWAKFFEQNEWIFGYGLSYRFLNLIEAQAHYGGMRIDGSGTQIGDYMTVTAGNAQFIVLVEIKRPDTPLVQDKYRVHAHHVSKDLGGAIAQVQSDCDMWTKVSETGQNVRELENKGIYTCQPKGIVVIGNTSEFKEKAQDDAEYRDRMLTFERYRRNLWNPEILTYDELLARAEYIVGDAHDREPKDGAEEEEAPSRGELEPWLAEIHEVFRGVEVEGDDSPSKLEVLEQAEEIDCSQVPWDPVLHDPFADE